MGGVARTPAVVKLLLGGEGANAYNIGNDGETPLSLVASNKNEGVVKLLLRTKGVNVDSKDNDGHTPLMYVASSGAKP